MSQTNSIFAVGPLRLLLFSNLVLQWMSSVVSLGLAIQIYTAGRDLYQTYWICIGAINVWLYGWGQFLPLLKNYLGFFVIVHPLFAPLWLTAFILAVLDYSNKSCGQDCGLKRALEAFTFLTFFFTLIAIPLETLYFLRNRREKPEVIKQAPAPAKESVKSEKSDENEITPVVEPSSAAARV
ncbi:hypothetical protein EJ08DRAFT_77756 [Tothia fuscella]|uniref:MARVEL domain-containing protein n=1 Tax=Tothia fuscella TaxID=1048955 RepID=A0A9P4NXB5_9PEZI|nr:hypothetical protein EJ08DRAFT_77756 [Tothia fuscella]